MHRVDGPGATVDNKFTEGDPVAGVQATVVTADILNAMQEEICGVIEAAGITLSKADNGQLLKAMTQASSILFGHNKAVNGYQKLPSGLIIQWVYRTTGSMSAGTQEIQTGTWPIAFPNAVLSSWGSARRTLTSGAAYCNPDTPPASPNINFRSVTTCTIAGQFDVFMFAIGH